MHRLLLLNSLSLAHHRTSRILLWIALNSLSTVCLSNENSNLPYSKLPDYSTDSSQAPVQEAALSVNEPIYFVLGGRDRVKARLQYSFKYRIFDEDGLFVQQAEWLRGLHLSYTQSSLWNISETSAPFEDSSYRPSLFWDLFSNESVYFPSFIRSGYEHESNGQAGDSSRSIDTLFAWLFWDGQIGDYQWIVAPKLYGYLTTGGENEDIDEFRGYVDLYLRFGNEDGLLLSTTIRAPSRHRTMIVADLSYPIREKIFARTGGYLYIQVFQGYGESLLSYNKKADTKVRFGMAIVR